MTPPELAVLLNRLARHLDALMEPWAFIGSAALARAQPRRPTAILRLIGRDKDLEKAALIERLAFGG